MKATKQRSEVLIALDRITSCPLNPRKHFDEDALVELAESIRNHGVLQAVLLRPVRGLDAATSIDTIPGLTTDGRSHLIDFGLRTLGDILERARAKGLPGEEDSARAYSSVRTIKGVSIADAKTIASVFDKPKPGDGPQFELIAGERRVRAARLVGLQAIPATIHELADAEVLEIAVVENEQRADTSAVEKADGYAALIERYGRTIEQVAASVGKSVSTIRSLLKLRSLPEAARKAVQSGLLSPSIAGLVARVPGEAARAALTEDVLLKDECGDLPSFRDVKLTIERHYTVELKGAPFDCLSLELVKQAGSCEQCPKRVGNLQQVDPDGYEGFRADVCTDPECYRQKVEAWKAQTLALAKEAGQKVLSEKEAKKVFPYGSSPSYESGYLDLAVRNYEDRKGRTYGEMLENKLDPKDIVIAVDGRDGLHRLVHRNKAAPLLKSVTNTGGSSKPTPLIDAEKAERRKRLEAGKLKTAVHKAVLQAAAESTQKLFGWLLPDRRDITEVLRVLALHTVAGGWSNSRDEILSRRHCQGQRTSDKIADLEKQVGTMTSEQLLGVIFEFLAGKVILGYGEGKLGKALKAALSIDVKQIEKEVKQQFQEMKQAKKGAPRIPKPSTNGKPASEAPVTPFCQSCSDGEGEVADEEILATSDSDLVPVEVIGLEDLANCVAGIKAGQFICMRCVDRLRHQKLIADPTKSNKRKAGKA